MVGEWQLARASWEKDPELIGFLTMKALAWAKALQGDYFSTFRYLKQCVMDAPNDAWRTMVLCERAYFAHARGENIWYRQELSDAEEIAEAVDWERLDDESVVTLLLLAQLTGQISPDKGSRYLARFQGLRTIKSARSPLGEDRLFQALVDFSIGVVETHLRNNKSAATHLNAAMKTYQTGELGWRAARCALRLFDLKRKPAYLELAERGLRDYPKSWLADDLRHCRARNPRFYGLSPMQDRVFRLLCEGMNNGEIASQLGIAAATAANHAKAVLKAFGVSSRHALLAETMRRGIIHANGRRSRAFR